MFLGLLGVEARVGCRPYYNLVPDGKNDPDQKNSIARVGDTFPSPQSPPKCQRRPPGFPNVFAGYFLNKCRSTEPIDPSQQTHMNLYRLKHRILRLLGTASDLTIAESQTACECDSTHTHLHTRLPGVT